jgi:GH15 family glucan-1,4-alpha-glucosidase
MRPTGGIIAAPTMSLPEQLGGQRNSDYRYYWLRDATFTLLALMSAGYLEEAQAWRAWLQRSVAGSPDQIQIAESMVRWENSEGNESYSMDVGIINAGSVPPARRPTSRIGFHVRLVD